MERPAYFPAMNRTRLLLCAAVALIARPASAAGQAPADTLRLADALAAARQANPLLRAARLEADAAAQRIPQAGALPDPQFQFSLDNRPLAGFGAADPMTMNSYQITQTLPWPGKLSFGQERARSLAQAQRLDAAQAEADLTGSVSGTYYRLAYMDRALAVMGQTRDLLRSFYQVSTAMYGVGTGLQQDVLQAQVAVARMTEDITAMTQERVAMAARLNALLGRDATAPVGALELPPAGDSLPSVESLMAVAAERRPALMAARQRVLAAAAGYREAPAGLKDEAINNGARVTRYGEALGVLLGHELIRINNGRVQPATRGGLSGWQQKKVAEFIEEHLAEEIRLTTLAGLAELSPYHFARAFK